MKETLLRWVKYSAVGLLGVGLQLAMLSILTGLAGLHYLPATAAAVESAILHNFLWHERWTFKDREVQSVRKRLRRLLQFQLTTGLTSLLGNLVFMRVFVGEFGLHYLLGNLASIASCSLLNFLVSDRLIFLPANLDCE